MGLADLFFLFGTPQAPVLTDYATAIHTFVDKDMPSEDTYWVAETAARWATWLIRQGGCAEPAKEQTNAVWTSLGLPKGEGFCSSFAQAGPESANIQPGLWGIIYPMVLEAVRMCSPADRSIASISSWQENLKTLACLDKKRQDWTLKATLHSRTSVDEQIERSVPEFPNAGSLMPRAPR